MEPAVQQSRAPETPARARSRGAPSIADVAAVAGVSTQTVSRVSTGYPGVRPETRDKVMEAMRQVGYVPNSAARALKHGTFRTIGIIAHQLARTGESRTVEGVVEAARQAGYGVTLADVRTPTSHDVSAAAAGLASMAIDGVVIIRAESSAPETLAIPSHVPVVVSDSHFVGHHPAVATDQHAGTVMAVNHLLDLGHHTVTHLAGPEDSLPAAERLSAWQEALEAAGRPVPAPHHGDWSAQSGYEVGQTIAGLVLAGQTSAVFCANDQMALGLYRALYERGLRIPEDVSVVGFDDIPEAAHLWPPLTSVAQDFRRIGQRLVDLLLDQIRTGEQPEERVLLPVELKVRQSVGPAPQMPGRP